MTAALL